MAKQKIVVVTGASAGVGRAVARRFAEEGAAVGLIARGQAGLDGAARDVERLGGTPLILKCDVADAAAVDAAADRVAAELGPIDVWVNNAMASVFSPVKQMKADEYQRVTNVTYLGSVHGTLAALRHMLPRDRGTVVQVSSALAFRSIPLQSAYCAAKHAIVGFLASLRTELFHDKSSVRVSMVHMPALNTPQFGWVRSRLTNQGQPVPPIYQPEVAADAVHWASVHAPRDLDVGVMAVAAIVGNKFIPGLLDRYLGATGFKSQQRDEPRDPNAPDNLFHPMDDDKDHGAHGDFDARAWSESPALVVAKHRYAAAAVVGAGLLGLAAVGLHTLTGGGRAGRR